MTQQKANLLPRFGIAALASLMGCLALLVSWQGISQLRTITSSTSPETNGESMHYALPVINFFTPKNGQVDPASIASSTQMTFLAIGLAGVLILCLAIYVLLFSGRQMTSEN